MTITAREFETMGVQLGKVNYAQLPEEYRTLITFGMIPIEVKDQSEKLMRKCVADEVNKRFNGEMDPERLAEIIKPDLINAFNRGFAVGLMQAAKECGQMVA